MYYHCRELKYVEYGKVFPPPEETIDQDFLPAYQWLGEHCGFFPQVWLSRSTSMITGMRQDRENILFAFENVQGFPIDYEHWEVLLSPLFQAVGDQGIENYLNSELKAVKAEGDELDKVLQDWERSHDFADYLQNYLFVKHDQVVVPSLNLKAAKEIVCRDERQKKKLRKMGFIEDRVKVRNVKRWF